jgi:hypothetical protein
VSVTTRNIVLTWEVSLCDTWCVGTQSGDLEGKDPWVRKRGAWRWEPGPLGTGAAVAHGFSVQEAWVPGL